VVYLVPAWRCSFYKVVIVMFRNIPRRPRLCGSSATHRNCPSLQVESTSRPFGNVNIFGSTPNGPSDIAGAPEECIVVGLRPVGSGMVIALL
jgi:hypothetical protein